MAVSREEYLWNENSSHLRKLRRSSDKKRSKSEGTPKAKGRPQKSVTEYPKFWPGVGRKRTPPSQLPSLETPPERSDKLRGRRYEVVPPVVPKLDAYERTDSGGDSWGQEDEDDDEGYHDGGYLGYPPPPPPAPPMGYLPYMYPAPYIYPPQPYFYPPPMQQPPVISHQSSRSNPRRSQKSVRFKNHSKHRRSQPSPIRHYSSDNGSDFDDEIRSVIGRQEYASPPGVSHRSEKLSPVANMRNGNTPRGSRAEDTTGRSRVYQLLNEGNNTDIKEPLLDKLKPRSEENNNTYHPRDRYDSHRFNYIAPLSPVPEHPRSFSTFELAYPDNLINFPTVSDSPSELTEHGAAQLHSAAIQDRQQQFSGQTLSRHAVKLRKSPPFSKRVDTSETYVLASPLTPKLLTPLVPGVINTNSPTYDKELQQVSVNSYSVSESVESEPTPILTNPTPSLPSSREPQTATTVPSSVNKSLSLTVRDAWTLCEYVESFVNEYIEDVFIPDILIDVLSDMSPRQKSRNSPVNLRSPAPSLFELAATATTQLLDETVLEESSKVVRESIQDLVQDYMYNSSVYDVFDEMVVEIIRDMGDEVVESALYENVLEDILEEKVFKPAVHDAIQEVALDVLDQYDSKLRRQEQREINNHASGKLVDSICLDILVDIIARQGKLQTQQEYAEKFMEGLMFNFLLEQYYHVQTLVNLTTQNYALRRHHERTVTDAALDAMLDELSLTLDQDMNDIDDAEHGYPGPQILSNKKAPFQVER